MNGTGALRAVRPKVSLGKAPERQWLASGPGVVDGFATLRASRKKERSGQSACDGIDRAIITGEFGWTKVRSTQAHSGL
jgi:hypothetical protein